MFQEQPESDRYDVKVLNAMHDSIAKHQANAAAVRDGEEETKGLNHYGEIQFIFDRDDENVRVLLYANYLMCRSRKGFFTTDDDGTLSDTPTNEDIHEVVAEAVEPLEMKDITIREAPDLVESGSGWVGFTVEQ